MKNLFNQIGDSLGGLGGKLGGALNGQQSASGQDGGLGNALGDVVKSAGGLGGLLGSAAIGGLLGTLLSGKTARKVAQGALMVGGTAAAGALAWKFYQKWSGNAAPQPGAPEVQPAPAPSGWPAELSSPQPPAAQPDQTALLLLEAMVFAARADGHIDEKERANIRNAVESLFPGRDMGQVLDGFLNKPLDPASLASRISNHDEARDLYRLSGMIIDVDHFMERSYLEGLASALGIAPDEKAALDREVAELKANQERLE